MNLAKIAARVAAGEGGVSDGMKYVVVYSDGSGGLKNAGYADSLPEGAQESSPGVWETGPLADGAPVYLAVSGTKYVPEEEEDHDPGPPSDPGSPYDTLEEKRGEK